MLVHHESSHHSPEWRNDPLTEDCDFVLILFIYIYNYIHVYIYMLSVDALFLLPGLKSGEADTAEVALCVCIGLAVHTCPIPA